jgi:hypothetical protein
MVFPNNKYQKFTSKRDAMSRAKKIHCCTACLYNQEKTFDVCPQCGAKNMRVFFPSRQEHLRAVSLIMMQKNKEISGLKFHQRYDLIVNGHKICAYEADASYIDCSTGKQIVEDTKPSGSNFIDKTAELKIDLFNALYEPLGLRVKIVR